MPWGVGAGHFDESVSSHVGLPISSLSWKENKKGELGQSAAMMSCASTSREMIVNMSPVQRSSRVFNIEVVNVFDQFISFFS